jgi:hypothetical protein
MSRERRRSRRSRRPNHFFVNDQYDILEMIKKEKILSFDESKYVVIGTIDVEEEDGTYRSTTIFSRKSKRSEVVLYFGKNEYEGLNQAYTFDDKLQVLRDSDGDLIATRNFKKRVVKKTIKRPRDAFAFFLCDRKKTPTSREDFENLSKDIREKYNRKAKNDRERYVRELSMLEQSTSNVWQLALSRIRSQLSAIRFNEMYLQSYESEGWSRSGSKSKKRKLRPEAELRKARRKIKNSKFKIRSILRDVCTAVANAKNEIRIPVEAFEDDFVDTEKICCAVCGSKDSNEDGNDILLCDRKGCNKAFHQKCLSPVVTDCGEPDDDWYCHRCQCHFDGLVIINEHFDTDFNDWTEVFPECQEIVDVNSPRPPHGNKKQKKKDHIPTCSNGHELMEFIAGNEEIQCNKCNCDIEEDEHFFTCRKCKDDDEYDVCDDCAHNRESRRYAGDVSRKRPPRRKAAVMALSIVVGGDGGSVASEVDVIDDDGEKEKEEDWGSDSGSDFEVEDDDDGDDDDDDVNVVVSDLNSPRGFGHRRRKKVDYVALAGELGLDEGGSSDDDREFTSESRLQEHELSVNLKDLVRKQKKV